MLVTDGQVGNEDQILQTLAPRLAGIRVFTLGIDRAVNEAFLRRLAELGRGVCELVESEDRLDEVMAAIHRQIGTPLLTGLALEPEGFAIEPDSLVPERLPDLFSGAPLLVLGRFRGHARGPAGDAGAQTRRALAGSCPRQVRSVKIRPSPPCGPEGRCESWRIATSSGQGISTELEKQIVAVSIRHHVLCRFTAYVAIDHSQAPNKAGKMHRITQPVEMPAGWEADRAESAMACFSLQATLWPGRWHDSVLARSRQRLGRPGSSISARRLADPRQGCVQGGGAYRDRADTHVASMSHLRPHPPSGKHRRHSP